MYKCDGLLECQILSAWIIYLTANIQNKFWSFFLFFSAWLTKTLTCHEIFGTQQKMIMNGQHWKRTWWNMFACGSSAYSARPWRQRGTFESLVLAARVDQLLVLCVLGCRPRPVMCQGARVSLCYFLFSVGQTLHEDVHVCVKHSTHTPQAKILVYLFN